MKKVISFLTGFLILSSVFGQGWERLYPLGQYESFGTADLIPAPGGGFLLNDAVQYTPPPFTSSVWRYYLRRLGPDGELISTQTNEAVLGARIGAMWPAESNRLLFVTLGEDDTTRLVKTDADLQPLWSKALAGPEGEATSYKIRVRTSAGGYTIAYQRNGQQGEPVHVIRTNTDGAIVWANDYTFSPNYSYQDFAADKQGNLFLFGSGGNPLDALVSKISPSGAELFTQVYPQSDFTFSPVLLNDDLLAFINFQGYLCFVDGNGQAAGKWSVPNSAYRLAASPDGKLAIAHSGVTSQIDKMSIDSATIWSRSFDNLNAFYDKAPFSVWSLPDGGVIALFVHSGGTQPYYVVRTDANGLVYTNELQGNIFADADNDCLQTTGVDFPAQQVSIVAQKGAQFYYATTDTLGNYALSLDTGAYLVRLVPPGGAWQACSDSLNLNFSAYDTLEWNTGIRSLLDCPWPGVDLSAAFLRRCFPSQYRVAYSNSSHVAADSAVVRLTLDPFLELQSASLAYTDLGNQVYEFFVGDLQPLETGAFTVEVMVSCQATLGQTHCSSADIRITNPCPETGIEIPLLEVTAQCEGDSLAFHIRNIGGAPMSSLAEFVVIEDLIVMRQGEFQLPAQGELFVKCPADGSTSRIYAGQAPGEPPFFAATAAIEGCNGPVQPGVWQMFPELGASQDADRDCQSNIGSFDPNDKQAIPTGYDSEHWLARNVPIDYKIRFQNTGTDTAFNVVVRDTLSAFLDANTFRPGAASHAYTWHLLGGGIVEFRFGNIALPDSATDLAASQGFVQFRIGQQPDLPLETLIENHAGIFFDFNDAVITNTVWHRIGENFLPLVEAWEPSPYGPDLRIAPNPAGNGTARLFLPGWTGGETLHLQLFDLQGRPVRVLNGDATGFNWTNDGLPAGLYWFQITANGAPVGRGKLSVR